MFIMMLGVFLVGEAVLGNLGERAIPLSRKIMTSSQLLFEPRILMYAGTY